MLTDWKRAFLAPSLPIMYGSYPLTFLFGIIRDITERKRIAAEQLIAELETNNSEYLLRKSQAVARVGSYY